ncbi:MAG: HEPN domain-containing protein, partial [Armatimonadetes bacterium]|nr:HEPN domain-containing protein [Armatimonadota bacterium]
CLTRYCARCPWLTRYCARCPCRHATVHEGAAFHCQQATEEFLKAAMASLGKWERTHSGVELLVCLRQAGVKVPENIFEEVRRLDRSYVDSRYDGIGLDDQAASVRKSTSDYGGVIREMGDTAQDLASSKNRVMVPDGSAAPPHALSPDGRLRVVSWNLHHGEGPNDNGTPPQWTPCSSACAPHAATCTCCKKSPRTRPSTSPTRPACGDILRAPRRGRAT